MDALFNNQKDFARHLRRTSTEAEATMWQLLRNRQRGVKLRRQHAIGPFIVDFYCSEDKLVVECDSAAHFTDEGRMKDERRTSWLNSQDIEVNGSSSPCPFSSEYRGEGGLTMFLRGLDEVTGRAQLLLSYTWRPMSIDIALHGPCKDEHRKRPRIMNATNDHFAHNCRTR